MTFWSWKQLHLGCLSAILDVVAYNDGVLEKNKIDSLIVPWMNPGLKVATKCLRINLKKYLMLTLLPSRFGNVYSDCMSPEFREVMSNNV